MNFAAPGLLLVFVLLPGMICRAAYLRGQWDDHPFRVGSLADEIVYGLAFALPLHALWVWLASRVGYSVGLLDATALAFGPGNGNGEFAGAERRFSDALPSVALYTGTLFAFAWCLGHFAHWLVVWARLDIQTRAFRFAHPWYYLLTGRILDFDKPQGPFRHSNVSATLVTVIVEQGGTGVIYRGALKAFYFDASGNLDRLLIQKPQGTTFDASTGARGDFTLLQQDYLTVFCREIKDLQVKYT